MHENSKTHKNCVLIMKKRGDLHQRIDKQIVLQIENDVKYWKDVLCRVTAVVKSLCSRGLSLRGNNDNFGNSHSGNFIMCLELIAEFDPFLASHIKKYANKGKGSTSYLSLNIYEEFVNLMGQKVRETIINEIKKAKYFSIIVDSTPDVSHTDQLSFIFRYVNDNGEPVERFLLFLSNTGHKSEDLAKAVFNVLELYNLDIQNCRGQSYDNASNMAGKYTGLQARIKQVCSHAVYVPCSAHSLNLVGECAANCCYLAEDFFNVIQNLYVFFSSSTHRWQILSKQLQGNVTIKMLSGTRWSARHDACFSLSYNWKEIIKALKIFENDPLEKPQTRCEARGLLKKLQSLEMGIMVSVWGDVLERFNVTSKKLQEVKIDLKTVISLYNSLIKYTEELRNNFDLYEKKGFEKCGIKEYKDISSRKKKRKLVFGESQDTEAQLSPREKFRSQIFITIMDSLIFELNKRASAYEEINKTFSFLFQLQKLNITEVRKQADYLRKCYPNDLPVTFANECVHFRSYLLKNSNKENIPKTALDMCKMINDDDIQNIYPYFNIALRMFLCCPASNCSSERSFSALKRVKTYLRSRMTDDRLNNLAVLHIESDITTQIQYDEIIQDFSEKKSRRKL
ncbi:zinc finger MYM-type protein 1-like [Aphis gossypii]|uniref:zinc finger MYM-type protein 1-like n=1 Tax=Aphis gossypii TaxID=80765 RepID=UPI00215908B1|nr:zinc finger MYM-type protein 1-like [Aphis gossypii]